MLRCDPIYYWTALEYFRCGCYKKISVFKYEKLRVRN